MRLPYLLAAALGLVLTACNADLEPEDGAAAERRTSLTASSPSPKLHRAAEPVPNEYIVVLQDGAGDVPSIAAAQARSVGGEVGRTYQHALRGYLLRAPEAVALRLAGDPAVKYVEENGAVHASATQTNATWGIDRVDQRALPLDTTYTYNATGAGVTAYIIDTGIRITHSEIAGRASHGFTSVTDGNGANDCNGHGTHVSGTVGGSTYGLAKAVNLVAVRVLDCAGSGTYDGVIAGIDWVTANRVLPAVANMSLGGGVSQAVDDAVTASVNSGVVYAIAAGNDSADACNYSPARTPSAITVGATTAADVRSSFSNFGTCVDIFAPGSSITSSWNTNDTATNTISGTSMATPHVCGAAALYLSVNPTATPAQVEAALEGNSTLGVVTSPGTGSPNFLLYTAFIGGGGGDVTPPTSAITSPAAGASLTGTAQIDAAASDDVGVTRVAFYIDGAYAGVDTTDPYSYSWDTTNAGNGTHTLMARAFDAGGNLGDSSTVSVTVNNPGQASYDASMKAPRCGTTGVYCDTGTLVKGRGVLGPETNAPNTISASCADGASGAYQVDESLERIRVTSVDGTPMAPGKAVRIDVTVWAWNTGSSDALDIYYASNASNPSWTFLTTLVPQAGGSQVLSATYTLPSGASLQAVRGNFRYSGTAGSCTTGSYDDHDDLVFAVGASAPQPPVASFTRSCSGLSCSFTDTSSDPDGSIASRSWSFGDGSSSTAQNPSHAYAAGGTYTVTLAVTDNSGMTASTSQAVTVTPPAISLTATAVKLKGKNFVDLAWFGASTSTVDVFRNGAAYTTVSNSGSYRDSVGRGTFTYRVCATGSTTCSNDATVTF